MNFILTKEQEQRLETLGVSALYLFGSRAQGIQNNLLQLQQFGALGLESFEKPERFNLTIQ